MSSPGLRNFINCLYPNGWSPYALLTWTKRDKQSHWSIDDQVTQFFHTVDQHAMKDDIYIGCALRREPLGTNKRGDAQECMAIPGVWLDVDYGTDGHSGKPFPPTQDEALSLIDAMGLNPTMIIASGHGLQAWWCFRELWEFGDDDERQRANRLTTAWCNRLRMLAQRKGWDQDQVGDLPRILRLPGTYNYKDQPVRPVMLIHCDPDVRYNASDLEEKCEPVHPSSIPPVQREIAPFTIRATAMPGEKFTVLHEEDVVIRMLYRGDVVPGQRDSSPSGFDFQLAKELAEKGFTDQEIINVLIAMRRNNQWPAKEKRKDYYTRTLRAARGVAPVEGREKEKKERKKEEREEVDLVTDFSALERAKQLENLSELLGIPVDDVFCSVGDEHLFTIVIGGKSIYLGKLDKYRIFSNFFFDILLKTRRKTRKHKHEVWEEVICCLILVSREIHESSDEESGESEASLEGRAKASLNDCLQRSRTGESMIDGEPNEFHLSHESGATTDETYMYVPFLAVCRSLHTMFEEKPSYQRMASILRGFGATKHKRKGKMVWKVRMDVFVQSEKKEEETS